jgi:uroporphyrinogen decarboxylase
MNSRERVLKTINREGTDRPPIFTTLTPQAAEKLSHHFQMPYEAPIDSLLSTRISHRDLLIRLGNDCVAVAACAPDEAPTIEDNNGILINEWGMQFKSVGLYNEFHQYPLSHAQSIQDIQKYPFPDPFAQGRFRIAEHTIREFKEDYAVIADLETAIFETAWYLVGLEKFMMDLVSEAPYVDILLNTIMDINLEIGKNLIKLGADIIWAGDDFGSQQGMVISPDLWRQKFKPRIKILLEEFRRVNPDIKIAWHSCGSILEIIPDFIEIGLDILNPIQPLAMGMDPKNLKKTFGNDLIFFGGIDIQDLLPKAKPQQIKDEVKQIIDILGKDGGFIVAPAHNIQDDTPCENVIALFEAVKEYKY